MKPWRSQFSCLFPFLLSDDPAPRGGRPDRRRIAAAAESLEARTLLTADTVLLNPLENSTFGSTPDDFLTADGTAYFAATVNGLGRELWKSDGTAAGTTLVRDLVPGAEDSDPELLGTLGNILFFSAETPALGRELYRTDGTAAGTVLIRDFNTGSGSTEFTNAMTVGETLYFVVEPPEGSGHGTQLWCVSATGPAALVQGVLDRATVTGEDGLTLRAFGDKLYFLAAGKEVWVTDGTATGTQAVTVNAQGGKLVTASDFHVVGDLVYYTASSGPQTYDLWRTDGTAAGTIRVAEDLWKTLDNQRHDFLDANGLLYFTTSSDLDERTLWRTDGSVAGTVALKQLDNGTYPGNRALIGAVGSTVYFTVTVADGQMQLWTTAGTIASTLPVTGEPNLFWGAPTAGPVVGNVLYFVAHSYASNAFKLWRTDGTAAGTFELPTPTALPWELQNPGNFSVSGDTLYFTVEIFPGGATSLWRTDGTVAGTAPVKDQTSATFAQVNGKLLFGAARPNDGFELWSSTGTAADTAVLKDVNSTVQSIAMPTSFTVVGNRVFYVRYSGETQRFELWRSDGTPANTLKLADFESPPHNLTVLGGTLFFTAFTITGEPGAGGNTLWKSDGTVAGTAIINDGPAGRELRNIRNLTRFKGFLYFSADNGVRGTELWRADGRTDAAALIKDVAPGPVASFPEGFVVSGASFYFAANDGETGIELWGSDGTTAGTIRLTDLNAGSLSSLPGDLTAWQGKLFFTISNSDLERELWITDGSVAVTTPVGNAPAGPGFLGLTILATFDGGIFFGIITTSGRQLWRSDGTAGGTAMVADLGHDDGSASYRQGFISGGRLYFVEAILYDYGFGNVAYRTRIWVSDGTTAGTGVVEGSEITQFGPASVYEFGADGGPVYFTIANEALGSKQLRYIPPGFRQSFAIPNFVPTQDGSPDFIVSGGTVYYAGQLAAAGVELWRKAGTGPAELVKDLAAGAADSTPGQFMLFHGGLYFAATTADSGRELWKTNAANGAVPVGDLTPGVAGTSPQQIEIGNDKLFFTGFTEFNEYNLPTAAGFLALSEPIAASNDRLIVPEGTIGLINVLSNDTGGQRPYSATLTSVPAAYRNVVSLSADGVLTVDARNHPDFVALLPGQSLRIDLTYTVRDAIGGTSAGSVRITIRGRHGLTASGSPAGVPAHVSLYDTRGPIQSLIYPFGSHVRGGLKVAMGDVTGDGIADIVVAAGAGQGLPPHVKVYDGLGRNEIRSFYAYSPGFTGGIEIAAADMTGDGKAEIIVIAEAGAGAHVRVFDATEANPSGSSPGSWLRDFYAFDPALKAQFTIAAGDINRDGKAEIVVGIASGGPPHVRVFDGAAANPSHLNPESMIREFYAFAPTDRGGVSLAVGDANSNDGGEVIVGLRQGGSTVRVFDLQSPSAVREFSAFESSYTGGVTLGAGDVNDDGRVDILAARRSGPGLGVALQGLTGAKIIELPVRAGGRVASSLPDMPLTEELRGGFPSNNAQSTATLSTPQAAAGLQSAVQFLVNAGLTPQSAGALRSGQVILTNLSGSRLGGLSILDGTVSMVLDTDAARTGWSVSTGNPPSDRSDLASAYGYLIGRILGSGPVVTGNGTLNDGVLPPGVRRLVAGKTLNELYGTDPASWTFPN